MNCPKIGQKRTLWCKLGKNLPEKNFLVGRHFMPCSDKLFRFLLPYLASIRVNFGPRGHKILGFSQYWVTVFKNHPKSLIFNVASEASDVHRKILKIVGMCTKRHLVIFLQKLWIIMRHFLWFLNTVVSKRRSWRDREGNIFAERQYW